MNTEEVLSHSILSKVDLVKKAKEDLKKQLLKSWKAVYKVNYLQAADFASIWEATPDMEKKQFCKKLGIKYLQTFQNILKQVTVPARKKSKKMSAEQLKEFTEKIENLSYHEQLSSLWMDPELKSVQITLGLTANDSLIDTLTTLLQIRNYGQLKALSKT